MSDRVVPAWLRLPLCELAFGRILQQTVEVDVDLLVVEADEAGDLLALGQRRPVPPREVTVDSVADADRPVFGLPLVGAVGDRVARLEQVEADVRLGQVVADW